MISPDTRLHRQDANDALPVLIPALTWQCLEWGQEYRLYHVSEDQVVNSMGMWVERRRVRLAALNLNAGGQWTRRRRRRITEAASPS